MESMCIVVQITDRLWLYNTLHSRVYLFESLAHIGPRKQRTKFKKNFQLLTVFMLKF